ncbi:MAG: 1-deoxy-D-xylulose-5-phosphate reductoisomerase [Rickettsiales bacterium]|nr:1-deoxy-D-xylulose-5-phosphate reductoisomerase [Rickettsiales bacterium]
MSNTFSEPKTVSILGATGSIGKSTVELLEQHPDRFKVHALTANINVDLLANQAIKLNADHAVIMDESLYEPLKAKLQHTNINVSAGKAALHDVVQIPTDMTIAAVVGSAGLESLFEALKYSKTIGLANKESLVCAGDIFMLEAAKYNTKILPIDSEHNAIYQVLETENTPLLEKIILTASGGSFREYSIDEMRHITPEQAVCHPNWDMGAKISVDSSTMLNKGLELIEAHYLFDLPSEQIEVLVHPESIIHSMVCYKDGSMLAQMGVSDMKVPISYALGWPERLAHNIPTLDLIINNQLNFYAPDDEKFPLLALARQSMITGNGAAIALNAANEVAVEAFLNHKIGFLDIASLVHQMLDMGCYYQPKTLEEVLEIDATNRQKCSELIVQSHVA